MPGSSEPHHGDTTDRCPGGKSGSALLGAGSQGRCWEEIHDAEAGEHHPGWKSYKKRPGQVIRQDCWVCKSWG